MVNTAPAEHLLVEGVHVERGEWFANPVGCFVLDGVFHADTPCKTIGIGNANHGIDFRFQNSLPCMGLRGCAGDKKINGNAAY
eukprot:g24240.t1